VDRATVLHRLHEKLGFKSSRLRWVPHLLTGELRAKRMELRGHMILSLEAARKDVWRHMVTGDLCWFFLLFGPHRMWALTKDEMATRAPTNVQRKSSYLQLCGTHMGSMSSIGSRLVLKSTAHIIPLRVFSRSTKPSFCKGEIRMEMDWLWTSTTARFTGV
jgi:hypothetical protein